MINSPEKDVSDEQYDYWEKQLREELYPSHDQVYFDSDDEKIVEPSSNNESNYFDDDDDDDLQYAADIFQSQTQSLTESSSFQSLVKYDSEHLKANTSKTEFVFKKPISLNSKNILKDCSNNCFSELSYLKRSTSNSSDNSSKDNFFTQSKHDIVHWQSFDSDDDSDDDSDNNNNDKDDDDDSENYKVVSQWSTESQLDFKIANNKRAQKEIKKRSRKKKNPFLNDEAADAYDDEECFIDESGDTQEICDPSFVEFINDSDSTDAGPSEYHLKSLLTQNPYNEIPERFKLKPNRGNFTILPDTDESDNDEFNKENEYDHEDSFICEDIIYDKDDSPVKTFQTEHMKLRSKRLVYHKANQETPEKPQRKKRKRRVIIESP